METRETFHAEVKPLGLERQRSHNYLIEQSLERIQQKFDYYQQSQTGEKSREAR